MKTVIVEPPLSKEINGILCTCVKSIFNVENIIESCIPPHHDSETLLLKTVNDSFLALDKGHVSLLPLLDLSAAYDTIDHNIIFDKLNCITFLAHVYHGIVFIYQSDDCWLLLSITFFCSMIFIMVFRRTLSWDLFCLFFVPSHLLI